MKILLTGGGSGGHFYPLIAVADEIHTIAREKRLLDYQIFYMADIPYNQSILFDKNIIFLSTSAGKMRTYFSLLNVLDIFKTLWGVFITIFKLFQIYPDVIFAKGGYVSFPALFAARLLRIPVVIHESDSSPGRVNKWASKFAKRIAISYPQSADYFPKDKVAYTGNPLRIQIAVPITKGAFDFLELEEHVPTILILGGSQGAQLINEAVIDALPELLKKFQIIHQTGKRNIEEVRRTSEVVLQGSQFKKRYRCFDYLNDLALRMSAGASTLVVSRAGSTIFEIAAWGLPSIIIPITNSNGDHQRQNAFNYAKTGACYVIEEHNLSPHILTSEIERLVNAPEERKRMGEAGRNFAKFDAAHVIAKEIIAIALKHE